MHKHLKKKKNWFLQFNSGFKNKWQGVKFPNLTKNALSAQQL